MGRILEVRVEETQFFNPKEATLSRQLMSCSCSPWIRDRILQTENIWLALRHLRRSLRWWQRAQIPGTKFELSTVVLPTRPCVHGHAAFLPPARWKDPQTFRHWIWPGPRCILCLAGASTGLWPMTSVRLTSPVQFYRWHVPARSETLFSGDVTSTNCDNKLILTKQWRHLVLKLIVYQLFRTTQRCDFSCTITV